MAELARSNRTSWSSAVSRRIAARVARGYQKCRPAVLHLREDKDRKGLGRSKKHNMSPRACGVRT